MVLPLPSVNMPWYSFAMSRRGPSARSCLAIGLFGFACAHVIIALSSGTAAVCDVVLRVRCDGVTQFATYRLRR